MCSHDIPIGYRWHIHKPLNKKYGWLIITRLKFQSKKKEKMRDTCWHDKRFPSCNWKLTLFTGWASLVSWSSCKHARMHVCHPTYALCAWAEIGVCEAGYPQCPKLDHLFCLFLFSFCCCFFFFFKFSLEPCVFLDNLNKQSNSVRSVWLLLKRLLHTRNRHDWAQHLFKWILDTVTKRHEMCFPKGLVFFVFVFFGGGVVREAEPLFLLLGKKALLRRNDIQKLLFLVQFSHFLSGNSMWEAGSDICFWPHMATGRPTGGSVCSQSLTSLSSTKRQSRAGTLCKTFAFSKRLIHKHMTRLEQPWMLCRHFPGK